MALPAKQHQTAIPMLFDWLVTGNLLDVIVRGQGICDMVESKSNATLVIPNKTRRLLLI